MKNINLKTILLLFVLGVQFLYAQPALDGHERPTRNNHPMERLDNNGDQKLSPEEFSQSKKLANLAESQISALFSRLDKNNDGYLTAGELPHRQKEKNRRHMRTKALDTNQDKQVSLEEFLTQPRRGENDTDERRERLFTFLDKNKDGVLSKSDHPKRGERPPHGNPEEGPHGEKPSPHDAPRAHPPRGEGPPHSPPPHETQKTSAHEAGHKRRRRPFPG